MPHLLDPGELRCMADYIAALNELEDLYSADPDSPIGHRFDELVALIEAWEARHDPIDIPPSTRGASDIPPEL